MAKADAFSSTRPINDHDAVPVAFTVFPNLPTELQLRVWKLTIPGPRVIKVKVFAAHTIYDPDYIPILGRSRSAFRDPEQMGVEMEKAIQGLVLTTDLQSPGVLFASKISREIALKAYPKCFELGRGRKVRFNPSQDTLLISRTCRKLFQPLPGMPGSLSTLPSYKVWFAEVTQLAMDAYTLIVLATSRDSKLGWLLSQFPLLKTLTPVATCPNHILPLLETQTEVQLYTVEEALAALGSADNSDTQYESTFRNPHRWVDFDGKLRTVLEAFGLDQSSPAGWNCPEIKTMFLGASSDLDPFPYIT